MADASRPIVLLETPYDSLAPLDDLRPLCCVRTGAMSLLERLRFRERTRGDIRVVGIACDPEKAQLYGEVSGLPVNQFQSWTSEHGGDVLCVAGACLFLSDEALALPPNSVLYDPKSSLILAHRTTPSDLPEWLRGGTIEYRSKQAITDQPMLTANWRVKTHRDRGLAYDLAMMTKDGPLAIPRMVQLPGVTAIADCAAGRCAYAHPTAKVGPGTIFDCDQGPIVLDRHATVRPGAMLIGPCYVGPHSTVLERATIRPGTAIGPWCKVNGEVGGTIFQGYSNKAHDGYLGDSWLGEWVNLGAGTTNSNLLNTYGEVPIKPSPERGYERSGETFLGAIIGDHVKTAICTRIMTGTVIHAGSMIATTAPASGCIAPFSWCTDAGVKPYRADKFLEVARAAMARRNVTPSATYVAALRELAERTSRGGSGSR
jgi:UDP-N-acetylglucosamine diphosphorylase/glucosamine-1-phosphate N-acetyltransferase